MICLSNNNQLQMRRPCLKNPNDKQQPADQCSSTSLQVVACRLDFSIKVFAFAVGCCVCSCRQFSALGMTSCSLWTCAWALICRLLLVVWIFLGRSSHLQLVVVGETNHCSAAALLFALSLPSGTQRNFVFEHHVTKIDHHVPLYIPNTTNTAILLLWLFFIVKSMINPSFIIKSYNDKQ